MLSVKDISFSVGDRALLSGLNFEATPGEFIAILGPNGAGKSTLMKLIGGQLEAAAGEISWRDQDVRKGCQKTLARQRAVLTQHTQVAFDFSVESIVLMGRYPHFRNAPGRQDEIAVCQALSDTDMTSYSERNIQTLSGGEQQRTHISRVLAQLFEEEQQNDAKLLLLDEPLNNLDIRHQHNILQYSAGYSQKGNVVLAVLHDINMAAMYAHKVLLMKQGRLLAFGTPHEVLTDQLLTTCYDFPARVTRNPFHNIPQVHFGCPVAPAGEHSILSTSKSAMI